MLDRNFIEKIEEMAAPTDFVVNERHYSSKALIAIKDPSPTPLTVGTLTAFADYLAANRDELTLTTVTVEVQDPRTVLLYGPLRDPWLDRHAYIEAKCAVPVFEFNKFHPLEQFIIAVQALFIQDATTVALLKLVGNLADGEVRTYADDGVTQEVTAKAGVARLEKVAAPNPVALQPYRTFLEIEQPASRFIFRLKAGSDQPQVGLFEADGGMWRIEAMASIKAWLAAHLPKGIPVLA